MNNVDKHLLSAKNIVVKNGSILLIEDNYEFDGHLTTILSNLGYCVRPVSNRDDAMSLFESFSYDVIVMDFNMPGMGAKEFVEAVLQCSPQSSFILLSALKSVAQDARDLGIARWLERPLNVSKFVATVADSMTDLRELPG